MDQPEDPAPAEPRQGGGVNGVRVHPTAIVEPGVEIGAGSSIWDNVHIRSGAKIGADCIVGEKTYIAYDVVVGDRCKINAFVYLCAGVTLETGVMASAGGSRLLVDLVTGRAADHDNPFRLDRPRAERALDVI